MDTQGFSCLLLLISEIDLSVKRRI
uniref:Humanin-like 13 n=4 Tax=Hominidae TaxID=9604 RepID=HMN13_HUMAN|nr:RecName: Full=Humanin-like 13; Short=HN13; AltName: Full=MT-RNR2-like protein 13 [Homo sapiens]